MYNYDWIVGSRHNRQKIWKLPYFLMNYDEIRHGPFARMDVEVLLKEIHFLLLWARHSQPCSSPLTPSSPFSSPLTPSSPLLPLVHKNHNQPGDLVQTNFHFLSPPLVPYRRCAPKSKQPSIFRSEACVEGVGRGALISTFSSVANWP